MCKIGYCVWRIAMAQCKKQILQARKCIMKKRLTAILLVLLLILSVTPFVIADGTSSYTDASGIVYQPSADGTYAVVADGKSASGAVTIPNAVTIGSSSYIVKEIAASAFYGSAVTSVVLNSSINYIGDRAFAYCPTLASFNFNSANVTLGNRVFEGSPYLASLSNYANLAKVGYGALDGTAWLSDIKAAASDSAIYVGKVLLAFVGDASSFTIVSTASSIAPGAFKNNTTLSSIDLSGITSVGDSAFEGCSALASITFGQSVINIGSYAFEGCSSLSGTLTLPASVEKLGAGAFSETCFATADLSAAKLTSIENATFKNCENLLTVILPDTVTAIGDYAFEKCSSLAQINAENVVSVGYDAFRGCTLLADKAAFANVEKISSGAFDGTAIYTSAAGEAVTIGKAFYKTESVTIDLVIEEGVTSISPYAFYAAESADLLALPTTLESIGNDAFVSLENGTIFVFSTADSVFESLASLTAGTVYIPHGEVLDNPNVSVGYITGITVSTNPTKMTYKADEQFDPAGMSIVLNTTLDEVPESFDIADIGYTPSYSYNFASSPTVTVSCGGYSTTLDVTVKTCTPGDLNNDEAITTDDLIILRKYIAGLVSEDSFNIDAGDLNKSGNVSTDDLVMLRKVIAGLITLD